MCDFAGTTNIPIWKLKICTAKRVASCKIVCVQWREA